MKTKLHHWAICNEIALFWYGPARDEDHARAELCAILGTDTAEIRTMSAEPIHTTWTDGNDDTWIHVTGAWVNTTDGTRWSELRPDVEDMTPDHAWSVFVGDQTVHQFLSDGPIDWTDVPPRWRDSVARAAVSAYVVMAVWREHGDGDLSDLDVEAIALLLARKIETDTAGDTTITVLDTTTAELYAMARAGMITGAAWACDENDTADGRNCWDVIVYPSAAHLAADVDGMLDTGTRWRVCTGDTVTLDADEYARLMEVAP